MDKNLTNQENSKKLLINPIVDICDITIDLRKIERVGEIIGDSDWLQYTVYFCSGEKMYIYHERKYFEGKPLTQMNRGKLVEMWRSFNS